MGHARAELTVSNFLTKQSLRMTMQVDPAVGLFSVSEAQAIALGFDLAKCERKTVGTAEGPVSVPVARPVEMRFSATRRYVTEALVLGPRAVMGIVGLTALDVVVDPAGGRVVSNPAHPDHPVFRA